MTSRQASEAGQEIRGRVCPHGETVCLGAPPWPNDRLLIGRTLYLGDPIDVRKGCMKARLNVFIGAAKVIDAVLGSR